jgi:hypothetical protein
MRIAIQHCYNPLKLSADFFLCVHAAVFVYYLADFNVYTHTRIYIHIYVYKYRKKYIYIFDIRNDRFSWGFETQILRGLYFFHPLPVQQFDYPTAFQAGERRRVLSYVSESMDAGVTAVYCPPRILVAYFSVSWWIYCFFFCSCLRWRPVGFWCKLWTKIKTGTANLGTVVQWANFFLTMIIVVQASDDRHAYHMGMTSLYTRSHPTLLSGRYVKRTSIVTQILLFVLGYHYQLRCSSLWNVQNMYFVFRGSETSS